MAHDVFISYASGDKAVADAVCATLESHGTRCWIAPRDVLPGLHYGEAIIDAIHECRIMVLVFSSKANLSGHIPKEIERAVSQGSTIMPLRIEDVVPAKSLDYFIGGVHWLDALTPPLEAHLQRLAADVQTLLARSAPGAAATAAPVAPARALAPAPPISVSRPSAAPAARAPWTYVVIGTLIAIVLTLGLQIVRTTLQIRSASSKPSGAGESQANARSVADSAAPTTGATASASPGQAAPAPGVAAAKKVSTLATGVQPKAATVSPGDVEPVRAGQPIAARATSTASHSPTLVFRQISGATIKLEQLIGDQDKERHQPTRNQTGTRYGVEGADLGYSFEHEGHLYFLFGDIVGRAPHWPDTIATTDASDPEAGVKLDLLTMNRGQFLTIRPTEINMGLAAGPVAGMSLNGQMYVVVRTKNPKDRTTEHSVLTKFIRPATFQPLRTISALPAGRFLKMSLHEQPGPIPGLPAGGPFVLIWGTGAYRESDLYLAIAPVGQFESGAGTRYFSGLNESGAPLWSESEADAKAVVKDGTLGDVSVTWCKDLGLWLMTYDRRKAPNGIVLSYSRTPWGPWSDAQLLFNAVLDGAFGKYIHNPHAQPNDGLAGPVLLPRNQADPENSRGAAYGPYVIERWTKVRGSQLDVYYTMSTMNPYVVVLMKSQLQVE